MSPTTLPDPDKLRLPATTAVKVRADRLQCHPSGKFLKGPIPLGWLTAAALLRGKSLAVGLAIWFLSGVHKGKPVHITQAMLSEFGVSRKAGYRGLKALEDAGLIQVERHRGRCPVVQIKTDGVQLR